MDEKIEKLKDWIAGSDNIVFFGGAGVSTESGIPDFRSVDGLYNQKWACPPETILSHSFFERDPEEYYRFHHEKLVVDGAKPNRAHHTAAGAVRHALAVVHLVGRIRLAAARAIGTQNAAVQLQHVLAARRLMQAVYVLRYDGLELALALELRQAQVRPDIVLYEEPLDQDIMERAVRYIRNAEVLIIGGTSLGVYPAAGLINYYRGTKLALVNLSETPYDRYADLVIHEKIGEVFSAV